MPLPPSGADIVSQIKSSAIAAADFGLRNNGTKPNNVAGAIQYNSSKPTGFKRPSILNLQQKLNNLVFDAQQPTVYFNTINQLLSNQPIPTIVTTVLTPDLRTYFYNKGIDDLTTGTSILNLATTNQNGVQVFDIAQIEQINPGTNHYIYFSDNKPIKIGNATIEIIKRINYSNALRVTRDNGYSTNYEFGDDILIDGETFRFLGSGSGGLFIYKGKNYAIVNTTNTVTPEINDLINNNIDGIALDSVKNIYIADYGNNRVLKFSNEGTLIKTYESQLFDNPRGIAIDSANNIYVTNYNANTLVKITATTDIITKVLDNIEKPYGICYNDSTYQRFYITCDGSVKVAGPHPTSGIFGILNSYDTFDGYILKGITVDSSGNNIYFVSENPNQVTKINTTSSNATPYYSFFNNDNTSKPNGITIDSSNNLYVVLSGKNKIIKITSNSNAVDFVNNDDLNYPQGIVFDSSSTNFYITNKIGINPVLIINNRNTALPNNGFPTNGKIKWICKNNNYYNPNDFYVLVNVTDSSQNIDSVYSCSITLRGAVYTKIFDYTYGQYNIVLQKANRKDVPFITRGNVAPEKINHTENFEPDDIYGNFTKLNVEVCSEYEIRSSEEGYRCKGYDLDDSRSSEQTARIKYISDGRNTYTDWSWKDSTDTYEKRNVFGVVDKTYTRPLVREISLPARSNTNRIRASPRCMISDTLGNIYITNYGNSSNKDLPAVYKYDIETKVLSTLFIGSSIDNFYGIEYSDGYIYFSNTSQNKVIEINIATNRITSGPFLIPVSGNPTLLSSNKSLQVNSIKVFVYNEAKTKISQINQSPKTVEDYLTRSNIIAFAKTSGNDNSMHFIDDNKLYKVTPSGGISNEIRQYADIDFRRLTHCVLDSNNKLYVVDDNINIYNLNDKTIKSNINLPKLPNTNNKQGFVLNDKPVRVTTILNEQPSPPIAVAVDNAGNIYYSDNNSIRKVTPNGSILITTTPTGDGNDHLVIDSNGDLYFSRIDTIYKFIIKENRYFIFEREIRGGDYGAWYIVGMFIDRPNQVLYFTSVRNNHVYRIASINSISSEIDIPFGIGYYSANGRTKIWYDTGRNLLSLVSNEDHIQKIDFTNKVYTLPGSGGYTYGDFVVDSFGNVYCTDTNNSNIRKITPQGVNTVLVGNGRGYVDGSKNIAKFDSPSRIAIEPNNNLIVIDNGKIRRIYTNDTKFAITDSNSDSIIQYADYTSKKFNSNIGNFDNPKAIVKDSNQNMFVLSTGDKTIYKINSIDNITSYATNLPSPNGGMAIDTNGIIYITNLDNTISKINSNGTVEIFITSVQFLKNPIELIIDSTNSNMYILNKLGSIAKVIMSTRVISELVGNLPSKISGLAIDSSNNLYFLNQSDNAIAKVTDGTLTSSFISGIINATDIFHENGGLYVLTIDRKYYFIDLFQTPPTSTLSIINNEIYNPSIPIATSTSITQPVKIPDGTEYINFVLIGGGGSGGYGDDSGGGSGAQLKFRIRVGINNLNYFKFEVGKGGDPGYGIINKDGGDTKVNFFSDEKGTQYSIPKLKDLFIAGGGKSQINGGSGGIVSRFLSEFKFNLNLSDDTPVNAVVSDDFQVLEPPQRPEGTYGENDLINIRGSLYGINGSKGDPLFNIFGLGGDLNSNIYTSYTTTTDQINIGTPTNTLNGNFKKISSTSSSKNFDLSLYSPGKGGDSTRGDRRAMPGNDGLVAWFFEGPSQYTDVSLDPIFKVPRSLMNQKFDNKWFTLLFKTESAIISTVDQNNSNNKTATFLCDTDGNVTLVNPGSDYIPRVVGVSGSGEVKIKRSENSIFPDDGDIMIVVESVGVNGQILTWSLASVVLGQSLYDITIPEGVTQVDCAMIGAGGNSGPYIREPLFVPTTKITFSIEVKYRDYDIITHGPMAIFYTVPAAGEFTNKEIMSFYNITIWDRTYTLTELCNEINNQINEQTYKNVGNLRFTILTKENYTSGGIGPYAHYGFITDNLEMQDFTSGQWDFAGSNIYTIRTIREYTMKLSNVTNNSFLFRTDMNNTNGREFNVSNNLPGGTRVSSLYYPSLLRQPINQVIPDHLALFGVNYVNKHPTHILPSFDGGDGSNGEYQRKIINVVSGDTLKINVGGYHAGIGPYITRSPLRNNLFSVLRDPAKAYPNNLLNGFNGNNTKIIHKRNSNELNTFTSLGGKGGLSNDQNRLENDQTIINKPDLPSGSFTYPTIVPPGWQDGYGKGGTTNRTFDTYDNPGVRGSHGCVMIKFN